MPASTISDSSETSIPNSVESKSSESTSYIPLYKSRIDRRYERYARLWGFDDTKTKEENINSIQRKVAALEEQINWKYPNDEEEIELEGAKKLVEILPKIITSLMPIKTENNPQQADWSFGDISSTLPYKTRINKPVTPMSNLELEILWQKATKRFGFLKEEPENNVKLAKRLWDIKHS